MQHRSRILPSQLALLVMAVAVALLLAQQGMTRAQWEDSINLMVRRHNMPKLDDKDRETVLNYLEAAYPPRAPAGRGGWVNPFAK